jgi:hypothetical protein
VSGVNVKKSKVSEGGILGAYTVGSPSEKKKYGPVSMMSKVRGFDGTLYIHHRVQRGRFGAPVKSAASFSGLAAPR